MERIPEAVQVSKVLLSRNDILSIPDELCPMIVLSDNIRSLISWGIKVHESGCYNHAMILMPGGKFASQDLLFRQVPVSNYFKRHRLKFWHCPLWTVEQRRTMLANIYNDLDKPWYKRLYDPLAIVGQAIHCDWIQIPGIDICSDKGKYLRLVDPLYDLNHPDPENLNRWLEKNRRYQVYGRYVPD
jgi:hypothetical protein